MDLLEATRMATTPSIKGSVFVGVVEALEKAISDGAISPGELDRRLDPSDLELLEAEILVSSWYDIRAYTRINELLRDAVGQGSNEYLKTRGRETARRLLEAGFYAQLEYLNRTEVSQTSGQQARFEAFGRDLRKLSTISASILNFSNWSSAPDPAHADRYVLEVSEAIDFPEVLCWRSDGFVNEMSSLHGEGDLWEWKRVAPDRVVFTMHRGM